MSGIAFRPDRDDILARPVPALDWKIQKSALTACCWVMIFVIRRLIRQHTWTVWPGGEVGIARPLLLCDKYVAASLVRGNQPYGSDLNLDVRWERRAASQRALINKAPTFTSRAVSGVSGLYHASELLRIAQEPDTDALALAFPGTMLKLSSFSEIRV